MQYTIEQLQDAYKKSSPKIQQILDDVWIAEDVAVIGKEFDLRIDKVDSLIKIIGLTLLNLISISDFVKTLEVELALDQETANRITKKVDEVIFQKVRDIIKNEESENEKVELERENTREQMVDLMEDIERGADDSLSFKDRFNKVVEKKIEKKIVDPYREPID